jgi:hypothetical protein
MAGWMGVGEEVACRIYSENFEGERKTRDREDGSESGRLVDIASPRSRTLNKG